MLEDTDDDTDDDTETELCDAALSEKTVTQVTLSVLVGAGLHLQRSHHELHPVLAVQHRDWQHIFLLYSSSGELETRANIL